MKAMFFNGSPRKNFNTAQLLKKAMEGAEHAGAETELVHLYDYTYSGCRSCFACKRKGQDLTSIRVCAVQDSIRPLLEKAQRETDIIVVGSPVYYGYPLGQVLNFLVRLMYPVDSYLRDAEGKRLELPHKPTQTAMIYSMNCPEEMMNRVHFDTILGFLAAEMKKVYGYNEILNSCDTYQYSDYSRYESAPNAEPRKRKHRDEQFPIDLQNAYELGERLVKRAQEAAARS